MNQVALDWPLTVKEKTKRLVQLQEDAITELSSNPAVVQSVSDAIRRAKGKRDEDDTEKDEHQLPMTPPKDRPEMSSPDGTPTMDSVVKNLHRLSDRSDQSQDSNGALAVDPALLQDALVALSKLCAVAAKPKKEMDEEDEMRPDTQRKSKSQPCRTSQPSALQKKRNSRGPNTPRVRFADLEDSGDETCDGDAKTRGRNPRRVSRGPDGKSYAVPEPKQKKEWDVSDGSTNSAIATAAATAVAGSVGGGFYGATGGAIGTASTLRTRRVWRKPGAKTQAKS